MELRHELMSGVLRPGAELSQVALAQRFGVSRIPIRDALRILAADGLVEIELNRGARAITLNPDQVRELYDLRILLECDCLRRAAKVLTPDDLDAIDLVRRKADIDAHTESWSEGDWAFHRALYVRADRPRQLSIIEGLRRTCRMFIGAYHSMPSKTPRWLGEHREIIGRLREGDASLAANILEAHLEAAAQHLLEQMRSSEPSAAIGR